ncbi:MAG: 50S ribosomal protein L17 [Ignavibacteriales bacterium]|nr:50S ribosomal protein L17 [Ignavibacteriales bacterium]
MRHNRSGRKLNRTASHRKAMLSSLSVGLLTHKRIQTTVAKAKETRMVVERLITKAKNAVAGEQSSGKKNIHTRRNVFAYLRDRKALGVLFNEVAPKVAARPGGYTRVIKLGRRFGDGAELAILELVDFNIGQDKAAAKSAKSSKPRSKKSGRKKPEATPVEESKTSEATTAGSVPSDEPSKP